MDVWVEASSPRETVYHTSETKRDTLHWSAPSFPITLYLLTMYYYLWPVWSYAFPKPAHREMYLKWDGYWNYPCS